MRKIPLITLAIIILAIASCGLKELMEPVKDLIRSAKGGVSMGMGFTKVETRTKTNNEDISGFPPPLPFMPPLPSHGILFGKPDRVEKNDQEDQRGEPQERDEPDEPNERDDRENPYDYAYRDKNGVYISKQNGMQTTTYPSGEKFYLPDEL